jgi:Flp pilus assembly protein TadB
VLYSRILSRACAVDEIERTITTQSGYIPKDMHAIFDEWVQGEDQKRGHVLAIIAAILIVLWLLGFVAFHVTTGLIHIVLAIALILFLLHFFRGRSTV